MDIKIEDISNTRKNITVELSAEDVNLVEKKLIADYVRHASLPGFRKGKAPEAVVRSKYAKEIKDDIEGEAIKKAYQALDVDGHPEYYSVVNADPKSDILPGQPVSILFEVDILPEFTLPEYKGMNVEVFPVSVKDEDVQAFINDLLEKKADYQLVEAPAKKGDYVKLSYEGKIDDQLISELLQDKPIYGTQNNTWEEAGADKPLGVTAVIEGIVGLKADDQASFSMTYPDDFDVPQLAGKTANYQVTVHEVRTKTLPPIDEDFLKEAGVASEDEFRQEVQKYLQNQQENDRIVEAKRNILEYLENNTSIEVPQSAIDAAVESILFRQMMQFMRFGVGEQFLESMRDKMIKNAEEIAPSQAKQIAIIHKIAKAEGINVSQEELSQAVVREASILDMNVDKYVNMLKDNRSRINDIRDVAYSAKVLDFLYDNASVKDKDQAVLENK